MIAVYDPRRERMVAEQMDGIRDARVLEALRRVPRDWFVPQGQRDAAFDDRPLPIGYGQTISQPFMVAAMTQALQLRAGDRVLEIGTGSGYQTAILCALGARVCTVERIADLSYAARQRLESLGYSVHAHIADGSLGVPEEAPFDAILVTAGAPAVPASLLRQMRPDGGRMVIPVGRPGEQDLLHLRLDAGVCARTRLFACSFVKLVGREGHAPD
jgi:protein-L-isoaspartate(D-aspartate) O-methyltransferase